MWERELDKVFFRSEFMHFLAVCSNIGKISGQEAYWGKVVATMYTGLANKRKGTQIQMAFDPEAGIGD